MQLIIGPSGTIRCIYDEAIDLRSLGSLVIERASHVEPDAEGSGGPICNPLMDLFWVRSFFAAKHFTPKRSGSKRTS